MHLGLWYSDGNVRCSWPIMSYGGCWLSCLGANLGCLRILIYVTLGVEMLHTFENGSEFVLGMKSNGIS